MIFLNKIYKISSGTNVSLFAKSESEMEFYVFSKTIQKYLLEFEKTLRSKLDRSNIGFNYVCNLDGELKCVCFDDNMSVIYD